MRLGGKKNLLFIYAEPRNEGGLMAKSWGKGLRSVDAAHVDDSAHHSDVVGHEVRIGLRVRLA